MALKQRKKVMWIVLSLVAVLLIANVIFRLKNRVLVWDKTTINAEGISLAKPFFWGAATAAHQVEGYCTNNNWYIWETESDENGNPRIHNSQRAGAATDHWRLYKQDIDSLKSLGCNSYRFSVEWSKIEPRQDLWNDQAIAHYQEVCQYLLDNDMTPFVTLHHFTTPEWVYVRGDFENEFAIRQFLEFTQKMAEALGPYVDSWATFNEPAVYAIMGWSDGIFPPGKKDLNLAAKVLRNMLIAHAEAAKILKESDTTDQDGDGIAVSVGLVKNIPIFDPAENGSFADSYIAGRMDDSFNGSVFHALKTGKFIFKGATGKIIDKKIPGLKKSTDWIGVNYYYQDLCKFDFSAPNMYRTFPDEKLPKTDMGWAVYPEGLYRAIKKAAAVGVPIYVTENGIATGDPELRRDYIIWHLYAVNKAINDGMDVRGYFYWTLMDNFEWAEGFEKRFGLYHVDFNSQRRTLAPGAEVFRKIIGQSQ